MGFFPLVQAETENVLSTSEWTMFGHMQIQLPGLVCHYLKVALAAYPLHSRCPETDSTQHPDH